MFDQNGRWALGHENAKMHSGRAGLMLEQPGGSLGTGALGLIIARKCLFYFYMFDRQNIFGTCISIIGVNIEDKCFELASHCTILFGRTWYKIFGRRVNSGYKVF